MPMIIKIAIFDNYFISGSQEPHYILVIQHIKGYFEL